MIYGYDTEPDYEFEEERREGKEQARIERGEALREEQIIQQREAERAQSVMQPIFENIFSHFINPHTNGIK